MCVKKKLKNINILLNTHKNNDKFKYMIHCKTRMKNTRMKNAKKKLTKTTSIKKQSKEDYSKKKHSKSGSSNITRNNINQNFLNKEYINKKLDTIILLQKRLLKEENKIENEENIIEKEETEELTEEKQTEKNEAKEEEELIKLKQLEEQIKKEVGEHPLRRIGLKDVIKGLVGAFVGLAVHYTFTYGVEISQKLDLTRSTFLLILSFFVGLMFLYATGFRKIKDPKILIFMPIRLFILYIAAVVMSIFVLYLFYPEFGQEFWQSYKMVSGVLLAAVVGACTADLIGKE